jgi:hypothetical protein
MTFEVGDLVKYKSGWDKAPLYIGVITEIGRYLGDTGFRVKYQVNNLHVWHFADEVLKINQLSDEDIL